MHYTKHYSKALNNALHGLGGYAAVAVTLGELCAHQQLDAAEQSAVCRGTSHNALLRHAV
jgi:hypothetical protein